MPELPVAVLALLHLHTEHRFEHRHRFALRRRHNRTPDLGLHPEHFPVRHLRRRAIAGTCSFPDRLSPPIESLEEATNASCRAI